jgi:hypothetical protein
MGEIPGKRTKWGKKCYQDTLLTPQQRYDKDNYTIDLTGPEATY